MQTITTPASNEPILTECQTLKNVISSTAEAEAGTLFLNGKAAIPICVALERMGHPQVPTPLEPDSNTAEGISTKQYRRRDRKRLI